tara:strand:- start:1586 stop:2665 length:1080 start_codon:yes stop_codon:yes gene_type:complete
VSQGKPPTTTAPKTPGGSKNDNMAMMLIALGGALKGDKDYVKNTLAIQGMQEGKKKKAERKKNYDEIMAKMDPKSSFYDLSKAMGPDKLDQLLLKRYEMEQKRLQPSSSTAGRKDAEYFATLPPEKQRQFLIASGRMSPELAEEFRKAKAPGGVDLTPGQEKLDTQFASTAESWLTKDSAQVDANIMNLEEKLSIIERGEADVSGKLIGITPEFLQPFVGQTQAKAFIGDVRDIVFQSLREKLGAQFTEEEGNRLVAAAYDSSLPEEINAKRLRRLLSVVKTMKASKEGMMDIYRQTGTLKDYEPPKATFSNIYDALVEEEFTSKTKEELVEIYSKTKDLDKKTAIIRYAEKLEKRQGI